MVKKRKSEATRLDEVDRTMYGAFRGAANSLSQLYTHAMNHQRVSFLAGERRGMEKLYQWIVRQEEGGTRVSTVDITTYLQNELEYEPEETSIPIPVHEFHSYQQFAPPNVNTSVAYVPSSHIAQHYDCNQEKVSIPPNDLSSPVRRTLQEFNLCEAKSGNQNPNSTVMKERQRLMIKPKPKPSMCSHGPSFNSTCLQKHCPDVDLQRATCFYINPQKKLLIEKSMDR